MLGILSRLRSIAAKQRLWFQYGIVGVSGVVVDVLVFTLLVYGLQVSPTLATIISTSAGITNNFIWNAKFTFKRRDHLLRRFLLFFAVGTGGTIASALTLLLLADLFGLDALWVKVLSVPPIVLGQFILNTSVSFGSRLPSFTNVQSFFRRHLGIIGVCVVFAVLSILLVRFLPYTPGTVGGPDEWQHYGKNVEFVLHNHRLPVSGQDDTDSLSTCRDNLYGQVPCLYSYQFTPGLNYVIAAMTARTGELVGLSPLTGARLASTMWGVLFVVAIYLLASLFLQKRIALGLAAIVACIPQIIFISSYVNQDIHSLAIATWLIYASVAYLVYGKKKLRWLWYVIFGLLFSAKYNYALIALVPVLLMVRQWWQTRDTKLLWQHSAWLLASIAVVSGGWYLRNVLLYHDLTGLNFVLNEMAKYHTLGVRWPLTDLQSYLLIFKFDALNALFSSFFSHLGYLFIRLDESFYTLLKLTLLGGLLTLWLNVGKTARLVLAGGIGFLGLMIAVVVVNGLTYDFQFQGRYVYAALPVLVAVIALALADIARRKLALAKGLVVAVISVMFLILFQSALLMATHLVNFYE